MKLATKLEEYIDVDAFAKEANAEITDVMEAMRTQTERMNFYATAKAKARAQKQRVEAQVKTCEAVLTKKYRVDLNAAALEDAEENNCKPERITQDMIKTEVALDKLMRSWNDKLIDADEIYQVCVAAYETFKTRNDMIQSIGHMTRAQMNAGILQAQAGDVEAKARASRLRRGLPEVGGANQG